MPLSWLVVLQCLVVGLDAAVVRGDLTPFFGGSSGLDWPLDFAFKGKDGDRSGSRLCYMGVVLCGSGAIWVWCYVGVDCAMWEWCYVGVVLCGCGAIPLLAPKGGVCV